MGRHSKIPKKNRKKLKSVDPFNFKAKLVKEKLLNKTKNFAPSAEQPLTKAMKMVQQAKSEGVVDKKEIRKRKKQRNRVLEEAAKIGLKKGVYETLDHFIKRVQQTAHFDIEKHKFMAELGFAGRSQTEIDADYKTLDEKAERAKEQKKREIKNKIEAARKRRVDEEKRRMEKIAKKKAKFGQVSEQEEDDKEEIKVRNEAEQEEGEESNSEEEDGIDSDGNEEIQHSKKKPKTPQINGKERRKEREKKRKELRKDVQEADAVLNSREIIPFGERYDAPPTFSGVLKDKFDPLLAKAGSKNLLLHSILKKQTEEKAVYQERNEKKLNDLEAERKRVIEAYRQLKKKS